MTGYVILGIVVLLVILVIAWFIGTYNKLVRLRNRVQDQWSQVDVQLKQRFDLIPNIVETVKGYAEHEKQTLAEVVEARNKAVGAQNPADEMQANAQLNSALGKMFALSESYPELKADAGFRDLQATLSEVEEKISYARQFYNDTVLMYKDAIETFPSVLVANMFGFRPAQFFEANEAEKENVNVQF